MPVEFYPSKAPDAVDYVVQHGYDITIRGYGTQMGSSGAAEPVFGTALVLAAEAGFILGMCYLLKRLSSRTGGHTYSSDSDAVNKRDWDSFREKLYGRKKSKFDRFFR